MLILYDISNHNLRAIRISTFLTFIILMIICIYNKLCVNKRLKNIRRCCHLLAHIHTNIIYYVYTNIWCRGINFVLFWDTIIFRNINNIDYFRYAEKCRLKILKWALTLRTNQGFWTFLAIIRKIRWFPSLF